VKGSRILLIEHHSDELAAELVIKLGTSSRTADLRKVPIDELRRRLQEILRHLSEWLLTKASQDVERHYFEIGERRASQGVALSDFCWSIVLVKEHLWEFLQVRVPRMVLSKFTARWNCCACWTSFSIAVCALRPRAMNSTPSCITALTLRYRSMPGNPVAASSGHVYMHNCQASEAHRLVRGDKRLKVCNGRSWDHYCVRLLARLYFAPSQPQARATDASTACGRSVQFHSDQRPKADLPKL
jgi:hypothetical protein